MNEIAKCPRCGEAPQRIQYKAGGWGCRCCGAEFFCITYWNQYAAAMELAEAAVWADECEAQKDLMDDITSNHDAWRSIVNLDLDANDKAHDALERVLEVFGGE